MEAELLAAAIRGPARQGVYDLRPARILLTVVAEVAGPQPEPRVEADEPGGPSKATTQGTASIHQRDSTPSTAPGAAYDLLVPALIPGYASLARLAVALLSESPLASRSGTSILVAGCGTGAELLEARAQRPDWRLTGLDPAAAMLSLAKERLAPGDAIDWLCCKVEDVDKQLSFDGALAVLVLQSLPDDGSKLGFLTALAKLLRPGAQLVLVDLMQPEQIGRAHV